MKAAVLYEGQHALEVEDVEMPAVDENDVLIRVTACGVCHTDLKAVEGTLPFKSPTILGHEVSGTIEQVGRLQQEAFKEGDRVIVGMRYKCGKCPYCLAGRENICRNRPSPPPYKKRDGTLVNRWNMGGFAQYLAVPGYMVHLLPEGLRLEEASIIGCRATTAYYAVKYGAHLEAGDSALVIGCGGIGLNTIQLLRCFGAHPIIAVDLIDKKLEAAKAFGATHTINASAQDPVEATRAITGGGVNKAFEAVGDVKTADQVIGATRPGGTAVIIGGLGRVPLTIRDASFAFSEVTITGVASRRTNDVSEVLAMAKDGRIEVDGLVTRKYAFEEINEALEDLAAGRNLMGITLWN